MMQTPDPPRHEPEPTALDPLSNLSRCDPPEALADPGLQSVRKYLLYGLSLPERALRSGTGVVGGALRESTSLLVPRAFQNSKTYSVMVRQMLDFMVEDIGGVRRPAGADEDCPKIENFVARKTVGNFVELAGLATLHMSPLTVLAIFSDVVYGSQAYLKELAAELKQQGVIAEDSTIDSVDQLLSAVAAAAGTSASAFDTPPLSVDGLRETVEQIRASVRTVDPKQVVPQKELKRLWDQMHEVAATERVSLTELSTAMTLHSLDKFGQLTRGALSSVRVMGTLADRHILDHYSGALSDIRRDGVYGTLAQVSGPYIEAVWENFSSDKGTITEELLTGRLVGRAWSSVSRLWGAAPVPDATLAEQPADTDTAPSATPPAEDAGKPPAA